MLDTKNVSNSFQAVSNFESTRLMKIQVIKSNEKTKKTTGKNWADRQKESGVKLELNAYPARNCWKKYKNGKMIYFNHPISKEGYESALLEWLQYKAELNFSQPYKARLQHYLDAFKPVQVYFDQATEQTSRDKRLSLLVDEFVDWLESALADPAEFFPDPEKFGTEEQVFFAMGLMDFLMSKKQLLQEFFGHVKDKDLGSLSYALPDHWQEKTEIKSTEKLPQTVGYWCEDFLNLKGVKAISGQLTKTTARDSREKLKKFRNWIGDKTPISSINSETLKKFYMHLLTQEFTNKQNYFNYARSFIRYCWRQDECNLENLPKNIDDRGTFSFRNVNKVQPKKRLKELWTKEEIQSVIAKNSKMPERYQCWILLMLNCGFTQTDLNDLKREEIDLKSGRIIRCRTKAENYSNAPIVNYKLWDKTLELLSSQLDACTDPVYALQASKGARLIRETITTDKAGTVKVARFDNTSRHWQKVRKDAGLNGKQLKFIRKTGSTTIRGNLKFTSLEKLYLGHSPDNIADLHYNVMEGQVFKPLDQAISYVGKLFGIK